VLVHGKDGKNDRILRGQGVVNLDFGNTREEEAINKKGEATFKELPAKFIGKKALITVTHPQPYSSVEKDKEYVLTPDQSIYIEVELKGIDEVYGRVLDFESETPLDSVRVSHRNIAAYSNKFGWFKLNIPPDIQSKFINLNFQKEGYQMENMDSIAPHTKQEIGITLKRIGK